jgi:transposase-like protein
MNKPTTKSQPQSKSPRRRKTTRQHRRFSAKEKVQAVLSVWTERRKPSHLCKEMGITWQQLSSWQDKGLTAMIEALEPRAPAEDAKPPLLSDRLRKLLDKQVQKAPNRQPKPDLSDNLSKRLSNLTQEDGESSRQG